ncbi:arylsulfatase [Carboxylicivirga sediminis]|uniref:Arylsulfatase n=1 Tax=Carboxylicivirga sediminis TaxID=2006564 RepID=A0A941F3L4_9BACT|nr:arylsulfatase [Carboxylicivirga sediminis]MBR8536151.1 arylsulfatase [Carboxylicivirga sediminis]
MKKLSLIILSLLLISLVSAQNTRPNIVIIYVDDLGYGDLSCYGATEVQTPNVDKLANGGVKFTDGHCSAATCTPSRYSLLTGRYAFRKDAAVLPGDAPLLISADRPTLPGMLKQNGYRTAVIGKWHLGLGNGDVDWNGKVAPGPLEIGFDYSYLIPSTGDRVPSVMLENHHVVGLDPEDPIKINYKKKVGNDPTGIENPELLRYPSDTFHGKTIVNGVSRIGYMSGGNSARFRDETVPYQMLNKARLFIDESQEEPFFLYFAFHDIHVPRLPDAPFIGATNMGVRGDAIVQMDYITGELINHLEKRGLSENTIIVFSSDNGPVLDDGYSDEAVELLGKHKPAGPFRGNKYSAYEAGTRVPTIVYWPGTLEAKESDALVTHTDLYASFAELIGHQLNETEAPDSEAMWSTFAGESKKGREFLLEESVTLSLRHGNYKYIHPTKKNPSWIKVEKNIESGTSIEPQLFDLSKDIGEKVNIAAKNKKLVKKLQKEIERIQNNEVTR